MRAHRLLSGSLAQALNNVMHFIQELLPGEEATTQYLYYASKCYCSPAVDVLVHSSTLF